MSDFPTDRLSAVDAAFLQAEDAATPMHVGGVVILEPTSGFDYQRIADRVWNRLGALPRYRQVVRTVPGRLARPVWIDDDDFDLNYHVRRSSLPTPGSTAELDALVGRLISRPLDRRRPLWELYIVEGLEGGRVALINKTHEALVDRMGAVDVAAALLETSRTAKERTETPWVPTPAPSNVDLVVDALADLVARPAEGLDAARLAAMDVRSTVKSVADTAVLAAQLLRRSLQPRPRLSLSVPIAGPRGFACGTLGLPTVKAIRAAHGGTVNDVILAVLAGAVRSWMLSRGDPVTSGTEIRVLTPMSVRPESGEGTPTVDSYVIDLPVAEPNPVMRLHQISYQTQSHAESGRGVTAGALMALGRFAPPTLHGLGARVAGQLSRRSYDMLVTNVPGPQRRLYIAGYPVQAMYPVVPLAKGHAVAIGCTSYRGEVYVGVTTDQDALTDGSEFTRLLDEAATELRGGAPPRRRGRARTERAAASGAGRQGR